MPKCEFLAPLGGVCVKAPIGTRCYILRLRFDKNKSTGHRPIVDTCANEAIPQWGKHNLISCVYLQFEFETVDKLFHCVVYQHSDSIRCPSDPCPFQFRQLSVANPISFRSKFPTSILFELHFGDLRQFGLQLLPDEWLL